MGFPSFYIQGADLIDSAGEHLNFSAKKGLVVADHTIRGLYQERLTRAFDKKSIESVFADFRGEATLEEAERLSALSRNESCDFVVGFGGGKAQDMAKLVKKETGVPIVVIPTIASSDAAPSRIAVTYKEDGRFSGPIFLSNNPDLILVDTSIVVKAPVRYFVAGIGDALATYFEAMECFASGAPNFFGGSQPITALALAKSCFQTVWEDSGSAIKAVEEKKVTNAVERVVEASVLLSGLGVEGCGVAAAHAVSQGFNQIEELHGALHGEEVAVGLLVQFILEKRDEAFCESMFDFYRRTGIPDSLRGLGLKSPTEAHYETIAAFACRKKSRIYNMNQKIETSRVVEALKRVEQMAAFFALQR